MNPFDYTLEELSHLGSNSLAPNKSANIAALDWLWYAGPATHDQLLPNRADIGLGRARLHCLLPEYREPCFLRLRRTHWAIRRAKTPKHEVFPDDFTTLGQLPDMARWG